MTEEQREIFRNFYRQAISKENANVVESANKAFNNFCIKNEIDDNKVISRTGNHEYISEKDILMIDRNTIHKELGIDHLF